MYWTANVPGYVTLSPGVRAIHTQTVQTTKWASGKDPVTGCAAGGTSNYQDNLYLGSLPGTKTGTTANGVKRSVGGNVDRYNKTQKWDWDIWFNGWENL